MLNVSPLVLSIENNLLHFPVAEPNTFQVHKTFCIPLLIRVFNSHRTGRICKFYREKREQENKY